MCIESFLEQILSKNRKGVLKTNSTEMKYATINKTLDFYIYFLKLFEKNIYSNFAIFIQPIFGINVLKLHKYCHL